MKRDGEGDSPHKGLLLVLDTSSQYASGNMIQEVDNESEGSTGKKYWAFISYSSKDAKWGKWLHKRLENYPIPKEFQRTELFDGAVLGKDLKPCFRDRDELSGSADLGPAIMRALNQTRYLIVLCSKNSAKSEWVNKEIEDFKTIGGEAKILALILDGEPNATSNSNLPDSEECFPPALQYPCEPLAGDMRKEGDGKERGFLKVLSGIAQLDFDVLYRRHEWAQRKKRLVLGALAVGLIATLSALSVVAVTQTKRAEFQTLKVEEANAKQDKLLLEASMGDHEAASRAFEQEKYNEGLAYLARAIRLKPDNTAPQIAAINRLFGSNSPEHIYRWIASLGEPIGNITFSADGKLIAMSSGHFVIVKDSSTGTEVSLLEFGGYVNSVAFSPDGRWLAAGSSDKTARVMEVSTGKEVSSLEFGSIVNSVAFSPDGRWLAAGSSDKTARVMETSTGKEISSLEFGHSVNSVAFSPDGRWLATGSVDKTAHVMEALTGKEVSSLDFGGEVRSVVFSPDGRWLAAGSDGKTARVIEASTGKKLSSLHFGGTVESVAFSPDGRWLAAGSSDKTARVMEASTGKEVSSLEFGGVVKSVAFSPDGRWLAAGSTDGTVRVMEAWTGKEVSSLEFGWGVMSVAFSPDGRWLAAGSSNKTARVMEAWTGKEVSSLEFGHSVTSVAFSPDGRWLAAGSRDKTVRVIETSTGKVVSSLEFGYSVNSVAFSPNGRWLAAGSDDKTARVIEASTGKQVSSLEFGGKVRSVAFSPDGRWLAAGSTDKTARVMEVSTGKEVSSLEFGHSVSSVAFSPDGRWLAAGSTDKTVRVMETSTGKQVSSLEFGGKVSSVAFSPDGRWLAAGSFDSTVRVIEAWTGKEVSSVDFGRNLTSTAFSPDGRWFAAGSHNNTVRVIDTNWWSMNFNESVVWGKMLGNISGRVFEISGKLADYPSRELLVNPGKHFFPEPVSKSLQPLTHWLQDLPEERMISPWSDIPLRIQIGKRCLQGRHAATIFSLADQAPWHPLVPVSLARHEEDPVRQNFLAELSLKRLRDANEELWGEETLAFYFKKSVEWMDEMAQGQVALDTAEEALKRNPGDEGVLLILGNVKERMERVPSDQ